MELSLEFIVGNDKQIINCVRLGDFDELDDYISMSSDFSLHIVPNDLNLLSNLISNFNNNDPISLRESLKIIVNEEDYGLFEVSQKWIEYFSKIQEYDLNAIAQNWVNQMKLIYRDEDIKVTTEMLLALKSLHELCIFALSNKINVYHFWYK